MKPTGQSAESRLADLENRLALLQSRVERLEAQGAPVLIEALDEPEPKVSGLGAEYWIGARLLPRLGAVLIILAIAFVAISEGSKRPTIDRGLLLILEALLCFGFVAVGEWKRDELEGFGKTLSAIGAIGLFLTAAGGHFAYRTLSETGMATVFACLSILTHSYAVWRNTRLFFIIGAAGGLAAMLYTLVEAEYPTALGVYTAVTVAAAIACGIRKWFQLAILGWLMGLLVLIPVMHSDFARLPVLACLYVGSLSCIGAAVICYTGEGLDAWAIGAPVSLFITATLGLGLVPGAQGLIHLSALTLAAVAIGRAVPSSNPAGRALWIGALISLGILGPQCLPAFATIWVYVGFVALCLALAQPIGGRMAAILGTLALFGAGATYVWAGLSLSVTSQSALLAALLAGVGLICRSYRAIGWGWIGLFVGSGWVIASRWSTIIAPPSQFAARAFSLPTTVSILYALGLLILGFRLRSSSLRLWSIGVMFAGVVQILVVDMGMAVEFRLGALIALGGMMLVGGYRYVREKRAELAG